MKRAWRKVLFEKQSYSDNYVDEERFMDQLNTDISQLQTASYRELLLSAAAVVQQFSVVSIFLTVYRSSILGIVTVRRLFVGNWVTLACIFIVNRLTFEPSSSSKPQTAYAAGRILVVFGICLRVSAPILQTLTSSFSDDTIHALSLFLATAHLVFFDYSISQPGLDDAGSLTGSLSLNAAVFTAVMLASRLQDIEMVVGFVLLAIISFSILPEASRRMRRSSYLNHLLLTVFLWIACSVFLYHVDLTLFIVYEWLIFFLWVASPALFLHMHTYKRARHGPWDEATVS